MQRREQAKRAKNHKWQMVERIFQADNLEAKNVWDWLTKEPPESLPAFIKAVVEIFDGYFVLVQADDETQERKEDLRKALKKTDELRRIIARVGNFYAPECPEDLLEKLIGSLQDELNAYAHLEQGLLSGKQKSGLGREALSKAGMAAAFAAQLSRYVRLKFKKAYSDKVASASNAIFGTNYTAANVDTYYSRYKT